MKTVRRPLALSMGEAAGIGAEISVKAWSERRQRLVHPFVYVGDPELIGTTAQTLGNPLQICETDSMDKAISSWEERLPVLPVRLAQTVRPGYPDQRNARATLDAIDKCVQLTRDGETCGVVTNPIHKATLYDAGFKHPGHTEYLAHLAGNGTAAVMMLVVDDFRAVPVTVHVPLKVAIANLTADLIVETGAIVTDGLKRYFGIPAPRIAVAGLNPHAGEAGTIGSEEREIITPAVERLRRMGIDVTGPTSADTMFHDAARRTYDAALCMYHDQALIPIKTIGFEDGVNCTLGLPFIRTSPDHGTALDIAGSGVASPRSLIAALNLAGTMAVKAKA